MTCFALIPAFNEEKNIGQVISRIKKIGLKPVVIDDGSKDKTFEVAKKSGAIVLRHESNKGKGKAIRTGIKHLLKKSNVKYIVVIDADMQYPPEEAVKLLKPLKEGTADFVNGYRLPKEIPYANRFGNFVWRVFFNFFFKTNFKDTNCGLIAFNMKTGKILLKGVFGGYIIDNAIRMEIAKNNLKISQVYVKVFYGKRIISKFAKMAFGNFFFIFIEGLKYRLGIKT